MFNNLRQNSLIYIFHKGGKPYIETGSITSVPVLKPKYAMTPAFGLPQEMVVDLVVKIGDQLVNYNSLPAQADIADSYSNGELIVISDSREAINAEILNYKLKSIDTINSIDFHKSIITGCEEILNSLNPEYAEKKLLQDEISSLKTQMSEMTKNLTALTGMIEQLTKKGNKDENVGTLGK